MVYVVLFIHSLVENQCIIKHSSSQTCNPSLSPFPLTWPVWKTWWIQSQMITPHHFLLIWLHLKTQWVQFQQIVPICNLSFSIFSLLTRSSHQFVSETTKVYNWFKQSKYLIGKLFHFLIGRECLCFQRRDNWTVQLGKEFGSPQLATIHKKKLVYMLVLYLTFLYPLLWLFTKPMNVIGCKDD